MERGPENRRRQIGRMALASLAMWALVGCQTVKIPEDQIAKTNLPRELNKSSHPDYVVEPPDLIQIEVLEPLPGRPIQSERLVRPDGTITLGFYGDVYVSGLTLKEIKEKVVIHLRKYLTDEALGLVGQDPRTGDYIRIDPVDSDRVFVDVASYNSHFYYVLGDVAAPGRLPITGNETVLDALQFVGGITPEAATNNIRLVRPAPPGACCAQELPVNIAAIMQAGDTTTNYQLLPGDRLFVYRDPIVRTTVFINRLAAPFNTVLNSILTYSFTARSIKSIGVPINGGFGNNGGGSSTTTTTNPATVPGIRNSAR